MTIITNKEIEFECNPTDDSNHNCELCCLHEELDHGICMECEKDLSDSIASDCYDRWEDELQGN